MISRKFQSISCSTLVKSFSKTRNHFNAFNKGFCLNCSNTNNAAFSFYSQQRLFCANTTDSNIISSSTDDKPLSPEVKELLDKMVKLNLEQVCLYVP